MVGELLVVVEDRQRAAFAGDVPDPGVTVSRGLLLDLPATGNREAVDAAMEAYIALVEARLDGKSGDVLRNSG